MTDDYPGPDQPIMRIDGEPETFSLRETEAAQILILRWMSAKRFVGGVDGRADVSSLLGSIASEAYHDGRLSVLRMIQGGDHG